MDIKAKRLKEAIENSGYSYVELEKITGISKSSIQRYATGETKKIPIDCIEKIAGATNTSSKWIMGWEDNEKLLERKPIIQDTKENVHPIKPEDVRVIICEDKKTPPVTMTEDELRARLSQYTREELRDLFLYLDFLDYKRKRNL